MTAQPAVLAGRAILAGAVCLAILAGMLVLHAWPLWTGDTVLMAVRPVDPRDPFRGEYVRLDTPATTLTVEGGPAVGGEGVRVRHIGRWWASQDEVEQARGSIVYVQLEPVPGRDEVEPVTISRERVEGARNLRGRIRSVTGTTMRVDYGLDAFYMQERTALPVEQAIRDGRTVLMEVAIARNGRSRIRTLRASGGR